MKSRFLLVLVIILLLAAQAVSAGSASFSGTFAGQPTMAVVTISTPNCASQGSIPVRYVAYPFTVSVTGAYNFTAARTGSDGLASMYIMRSDFNPAAALSQCVAGANSGGGTGGSAMSNINLTAGTPYYLVVIDDTFTQVTTGYTGTANGVGDIVFVVTATANNCPNPLPSGSTQRNVPLGAPAYYAADSATRTTFDLPAGNWWVPQISGDFAQVWIACEANLIWIPITALGG